MTAVTQSIESMVTQAKVPMVTQAIPGLAMTYALHSSFSSPRELETSSDDIQIDLVDAHGTVRAQGVLAAGSVLESSVSGSLCDL